MVGAEACICSGIRKILDPHTKYQSEVMTVLRDFEEIVAKDETVYLDVSMWGGGFTAVGF